MHGMREGERERERERESEEEIKALLRFSTNNFHLGDNLSYTALVSGI